MVYIEMVKKVGIEVIYIIFRERDVDFWDYVIPPKSDYFFDFFLLLYASASGLSLPQVYEMIENWLCWI